MNRRRFFTVAFIGSVTTSPLVAGCSATPSATPAAPPAPAAAPAAPPNSVIASTSGKTVADYFIDFLSAFGVEVVAGQVGDWLQSLSGTQKQYASKAESDMRSMDFINYSTPVYNFENKVIFFGMSQRSGPDTCVAFMGKRAVSLVEGPALLGIALSGLNWERPDISAPAALLPIKAYQKAIINFNISSSDPFLYDTPAGKLRINYDANPVRKEGLVRVESVIDNLKVHDRTFDISWT